MDAAASLPVPPDITPEHTMSSPEWGMASFLLSEVAFFVTLIVTYVAMMGRDIVGPSPNEALRLPIVLLSTLCMLGSSVTIHGAERCFSLGAIAKFRLLLGATIALGILFLVLTGYEWYDLVVNKQLTISRNLFGTTYYTLVGFHALHVTVGVFAMLTLLLLALAKGLSVEHQAGVRLVAWYWHFVDAVWIVVFFVVYIASRNIVSS
jgi:cytochrome c oxidase subunit 3